MRRCLFLPLLACTACTAGDPAAGAAVTLTHTFPAVAVDAYEERTGDCQSWTLDNEKDVWVNTVEMSAGPGWHHSNWVFAPDTMFEGPDGTWPCASRDYDEVQAGLAGGVLFAQSTQSTGEVQQFPAGEAVLVPDHSRILSQIHLVNASDTPIDTAITLTLQTLREEDVETRLRPFVTSYFPLDLPPLAYSEFGATCDVAEVNNGPLDFGIHYLVPHYHNLGTGFYLRAVTPSGTITVFDEDGLTGEAGGWGRMFDPPVDLTGATAIEFGCRFHNTTDAPVGFGNFDGEMCMALSYSDDNRRWVGGVFDGPSVVVGTSGTGATVYTAPCGMLRI